MDASRELSVGELIEHLLADSLIDACHITEESVTVVQGTERHSFPYEQARTFLMGMVRGRSWNLKSDEPERVAARPGSGGAEEEASDAVRDPELDLGRAGPPQKSDADDVSSRAGRVDEMRPPLDELLDMAVDMGLIERASNDLAGGTVTVELTTCETQMRGDEAIVFVTECILNRLNALRMEGIRQPESVPISHANANLTGEQESLDRSAPDRPEQRRRAHSAGDDAPPPGSTVAGKPNWEPLSRCIRPSGIS